MATRGRGVCYDVRTSIGELFVWLGKDKTDSARFNVGDQIGRKQLHYMVCLGFTTPRVYVLCPFEWMPKRSNPDCMIRWYPCRIPSIFNALDCQIILGLLEGFPRNRTTAFWWFLGGPRLFFASEISSDTPRTMNKDTFGLVKWGGQSVQIPQWYWGWFPWSRSPKDWWE